MNVANKLICLNLNAHWQPTGYKTVKDAIVQLCGSELNGNPDALAIDIDYDLEYPTSILEKTTTILNSNKD